MEENLQGRIIALELMMRGFLTKEALGAPDSLGAIDQMARELILSLQIVGRPADAHADAVFAEAGDAIRREMAQVRLRVEATLS